MKIYSKTGDNGETFLLNGERVSKNDGRIHFEGAADELNSQLGLIKAMIKDSENRNFIEGAQRTIMTIMSHVSDSENEKYQLTEKETAILENEIDRLTGNLSKELDFVLPGKSVLEAQIHIARAAARKTERDFIEIYEKYNLCKNALVYLNRLSDYLFVLSQNY